LLKWPAAFRGDTSPPKNSSHKPQKKKRKNKNVRSNRKDERREQRRRSCHRLSMGISYEGWGQKLLSIKTCSVSRWTSSLSHSSSFTRLKARLGVFKMAK